VCHDVGSLTAVAVEVSVLLPCLNEAETLGTCIDKAKASLTRLGVSGEVIVADNGSTDGSVAIAEAHGARVVHVPRRGYGAALRAGIDNAAGTFTIMADADDSYDLTGVEPFIEALRNGADLVIGNRFQGGIEPGAMPALHRYLGNPVLSFLGRLFYRVPVGDFHCGMRGFRTEGVRALDVRTPGMEFASEMIVRASLAGLDIREVPTTLSPDGRSRGSHLRTWRDGWRHLRFLLVYSPLWLFFIPGGVLTAAGVAGLIALGVGPVRIGTAGLDANSMLIAAAATVLGTQAMWFYLIAQSIAVRAGLLPAPRGPLARVTEWRLEAWLLLGAGLAATGAAILIGLFTLWAAGRFGALDTGASVRSSIIGVTLLMVGAQTVLSSFLRDAVSEDF